MSGSSKTVSALMGWNVNLNIYHRVQSKLLHERGRKKSGCLYLSGPARRPEGIVSAVHVEYLLQHPGCVLPPLRGRGGGLAPLDRLQMKSEKQVDVTNETQ